MVYFLFIVNIAYFKNDVLDYLVMLISCVIQLSHSNNINFSYLKNEMHCYLYVVIILKCWF